MTAPLRAPRAASQPARVPEFSALTLSSPPPPRDSARYLQVSDRPAGTARFNATANGDPAIETRHVTVSGLRVVLEDAPSHPLFARLNGRTDIAALTIAADEVVVRSPLDLPGTAVTIVARQLSFVGDGRIATTPRARTIAADGDMAHDGQAGGAVSLFVRELDTPGETVRLVTEGAKGQDARHGKKGADGSAVTPWDGKVANTGTAWGGNETLSWTVSDVSRTGGFTPISAEVQAWQPRVGGPPLADPWVAYGEPYRVGSDDWPTDGKRPELDPGEPGLGGAGGDVHSRFAERLAPRSRQTAGAPGRKAPDLPEAKAGTPVKSCRVKVGFRRYSFPHLKMNVGGHGVLNMKTDTFEVADKQTAKAYPAVPAPGPRRASGPRDGRQLDLQPGNPAYWIHPLALAAVTDFARDAFRGGRPEAARPLVGEYLEALEAAAASPPAPAELADAADRSEDAGGLPLELVVPLAALRDLADRMDGPNDFFGNPAGWVPALSLQSALSVFRSETDDAIERLYLSYWMEHNQAGKAAQAQSAKAALGALQAEARQAAEAYAGVLTDLERLEEDEAQLARRIATFVDDLARLEADLRRGARHDLQAEKILRASGKILGGVAQLIPVGQPALAAFGQGLSALADWDSDEPFESVTRIGGAVWDSRLVGDVLLPKAKAAGSSFLGLADTEKTEAQKSDFDKELEKQELSAEVKTHIQRKSDAKSQIGKALGSLSVSEDELDAAVAKATADSPEYREMAEKLAALNADKAAYAARIRAAAAALEAAANTLVANRLAQIELRATLSEASAGLSPEGLRYTRAMGERALERLQRYQYWFAGAYLYLWLEQPPKYDPHGEAMFEALRDVLQPADGGKLDKADFATLRTVFEESLKSLADRVVSYFAETRPGGGRGGQGGGSSGGTIDLELGEADLAALNGPAGRVAIDPMELGKLHLGLEDVRLYDVAVTEATLLDPPAEAVNLRIRVRHPDPSDLRRDGKLYRFRNTARRWGAIVGNRGDGTPKPETPDPVERSLLRYLLGEGAADAPLFTRPSAWAALEIERTLLDMTSEWPARLASLRLQIRYTARDVDPNFASLFVAVPGRVAPPIALSHADVGGRQDGVGSVLRTFRRPTPVRLSAPARFGRHLFAGWRLAGRDGTLPADAMLPLVAPESAAHMGDPGSLIVEPELDLAMDGHVHVTAVYIRPAAGRDAGALDAWPAGPEGWDVHDWLLVNESDGPMEAVKIDYPPWAGGAAGHGIAAGTPMGNARIKLALGALTAAPGESVPLSLFVNPAEAPRAGFQMSVVLAGGVSPFFDGQAQLKALVRWSAGRWVDAGDALAADPVTRTVRFRGA